jgi:hypothetical protein
MQLLSAVAQLRANPESLCPPAQPVPAASQWLNDTFDVLIYSLTSYRAVVLPEALVARRVLLGVINGQSYVEAARLANRLTGANSAEQSPVVR